MNSRDVVAPYSKQAAYWCPCCHFLTLHERGHFEICAVCFWEDDGQDDHDADEVRGGPNGELSLAQARINFSVCGACDPAHLKQVRPPTDAERQRRVPDRT